MGLQVFFQEVGVAFSSGVTDEDDLTRRGDMLSYFRRHKLLAFFAAVVLTGLWYWFRPEKLFITHRVDELPPPATWSSDPQLVYTTRLKTQLHETNGRASIYRQQDGSFLLLLTDFKTSNGPDVHVVLTTADDPALQSKTLGSGLHSVEIASLKGNEGDQSYTVPADTDLDRYNTVAIYCERFHAIFGAGTLQKF